MFVVVRRSFFRIPFKMHIGIAIVVIIRRNACRGFRLTRVQPSKGTQSEPHPRAVAAADVPGRCSTPRVGVILIRVAAAVPITRPSPSTIKL